MSIIILVLTALTQQDQKYVQRAPSGHRVQSGGVPKKHVDAVFGFRHTLESGAPFPQN